MAPPTENELSSLLREAAERVESRSPSIGQPPPLEQQQQQQQQHEEVTNVEPERYSEFDQFNERN